MMIREREIKDYVGLSGNVVVLQTCWEWFVREEDRGNRIIRAVLHLDEWAIPQHGVNDFGMSWEDLVMKRIEENQRTMVEMNKESEMIGFHDIINAEFVSAIKCHTMYFETMLMIPSMEMFALDSVGHNRKECKKIDTVIILDVDNVLRDEVLQDLGFS
ncbi:uncharacterized protein HKW66_Vig0114670 [Vigna angularis]|uniref:Uncharacterized protein n=1 Tax=Phaseolus angularis TaxID=3914 RepID=A0A8T0L3H6_PHAAN|nr:uncharacterized protein HKW66_Vig0114670 [Vigna angularis]